MASVFDAMPDDVQHKTIEFVFEAVASNIKAYTRLNQPVSVQGNEILYASSRSNCARAHKCGFEGWANIISSIREETDCRHSAHGRRPLKYERGRVQTDGEYKLLILLIYLSRTIECETIKNLMHCAGSHEIQIPTTMSTLIQPNLISSTSSSLKCTMYMPLSEWLFLAIHFPNLIKPFQVASFPCYPPDAMQDSISNLGSLLHLKELDLRLKTNPNRTISDFSFESTSTTPSDLVPDFEGADTQS